MRYSYSTLARYVTYSVGYQGIIKFHPSRYASERFKKAVSDAAAKNGTPNPWDVGFLCYDCLYDAMLSGFSGVLDDDAIAYISDRYIDFMDRCDE